MPRKIRNQRRRGESHASANSQLRRVRCHSGFNVNIIAGSHAPRTLPPGERSARHRQASGSALKNKPLFCRGQSTPRDIFSAPQAQLIVAAGKSCRATFSPRLKRASFLLPASAAALNMSWRLGASLARHHQRLTSRGIEPRSAVDQVVDELSIFLARASIKNICATLFPEAKDKRNKQAHSLG